MVDMQNKNRQAKQAKIQNATMSFSVCIWVPEKKLHDHVARLSAEILVPVINLLPSLITATAVGVPVPGKFCFCSYSKSKNGFFLLKY